LRDIFEFKVCENFENVEFVAEAKHCSTVLARGEPDLFAVSVQGCAKEGVETFLCRRIEVGEIRETGNDDIDEFCEVFFFPIRVFANNSERGLEEYSEESTASALSSSRELRASGSVSG
jgi:hypothetical protein